MKKILYCICATFVMIGMTSCAKDNITTGEERGQMTIVASLDDDDATKAILDGDDIKGYKTIWEEGDQIKIYCSQERKNYIYTLSEGAGTRVGIFTGDQLPAGSYKATYGEGFSYTSAAYLNPDQKYTSELDVSHIPITADLRVWYLKDVINELVYTNFKNATGLVRLSLKGAGTVKQIKVIADKNISGAATISASNGAAVINQSGSNAYNYVSLNCSDSGVELNPEEEQIFYIAIPEGDYTGVKFEITDVTGCKATKTLKAEKSIDVVRAKIKKVNIVVDEYIYPSELPGKFRVFDYYVQFSRGNLMYDTSTNSFGFRQHQNEVGDSYQWDVDATRARNHTADTDNKKERFLFTNKDATSPNSSFVVNGEKGVYRTLSRREWNSFANGNSRSMGVKVVDVDNCVVFYPIDYTGQKVENNDKTTFADKITWQKAEAAGALCIVRGTYWPSDLYRDEVWVQYEGNRYEWTMTHCFFVTPNYVNLQLNGQFYYPNNQFQLRLVKAAN